MKRFISIIFALIMAITAFLPTGAKEERMAKLCTYRTLGDFSPYNIKDDVEYEAVRFVFDCLYYIDEDEHAQEMMAFGLEISEDYKEYKMSLRDDLFWHDGNKVTIDDVLFTFENAKNVDWFKECVRSLESVSAEGGNIVFKLKYSNANFMKEAICYIPVVPKAYYEKGEYVSIGCGAFKLDILGNKYILTATDYYLTNTNVDRLEIDILPSMADCVEGVIKADYDTVFGNIDKASYEMFDKDMHERISVYGLNTDMMFFNCQNELLKNAPVRKAISLAVDYDKMVEEVYGGNADKGTMGFFSKRLAFANRELEGVKNVEMAKTILYNAGFANEAGLIIAASDNAPTLNIAVEIGKEPVAEIVKQGLGEIGIMANVIPMEKAELEGKLKSGEFDCAITELKSYYQYCETSIGALMDENYANYGRFNSEAINFAFNEYMQETDTEKKFEKLLALQQNISNEMPFIALCYPEKLGGYEKSNYTAFSLKEGVGVYSVLSFITNKKYVAEENNKPLMEGAGLADIGFLKPGITIVGFIVVAFGVFCVYYKIKNKDSE
ncbi:MAG: ABC transporter substrate-binding protein [Clostridia bacterium]|nr:ABC transporter substrate-binding protein [Clostridia bacterium]